MMLRGLDLLADAPGVNDTAAQAFATLSGRDSRAWPADQYVRGQRVVAFEQDGVHRIRAAGGIGEAVYALGIARQGDYRLRFHVSGPAAAEAELTKAGSDDVLRSFTVPAAPVMGWIDAGAVHLDPGAYDATVLLPEGSVLEYVELAPPCLHPIEPRGGWKASAAATTEDVAVTVLQALDLESELPPAAPPIELRGSDLQLEDGSRAVDASPAARGPSAAGRRARASSSLADIPETGLYTLSVFGVPGGGQRWMADGCRKCVVCPSSDPLPRWRVRPLRRSSRRARTSSPRASGPTPSSSASVSSRRRTRRPTTWRPSTASASSSAPPARSAARRRRRRAASSSAAARSRRWSCAATSCGPAPSSPSSPPRGRAAPVAAAAGARRRRWRRGRRGRRRRRGAGGGGGVPPPDHPAAAAAEPGAARPLRGRKLRLQPPLRRPCTTDPQPATYRPSR